MVLHTLIYSFSREMSDREREEFFAEVAKIMLDEGRAETVSTVPHLPLLSDEHAPTFAASAISCVAFPDLDALAMTSALPAMRDFVSRSQSRHPYQVVWANHTA